MTTVACAYDAIAHEYDAHLAGDPVALYMRARLHEHMRCLFHPGDHVLDLSAGTGTDACYLAALGVQVTAIDASPCMIAELKRTAVRRGVQVDARVLSAECLDELDLHNLGGAISTFAGLNTMDGLPRLAQNLAERLRPHGRVILHALNDFCLWRWVAHLGKSKLGVGMPTLVGAVEQAKACTPDSDRRWAYHQAMIEVSIGRQVVPHRVYNPFALWRAVFAEQFYLRRVYGLSVVAGLPLIKRFPCAGRPLFVLDRILGRVFPAAGDFFVIELEKRD